jgi:hypothetical protein
MVAVALVFGHGPGRRVEIVVPLGIAPGRDQIQASISIPVKGRHFCTAPFGQSIITFG